MKRVVIVHGWDGSPNEPMHIWLASTLKDKGYEVIVPAMPAPETPVIENWIAKLKEVAPVDENTVLVGHSVGCQAVLRYTETFPEGTKVRGIVLVAPWMELDETTIEEEGEEIKEIARPWMETPIDFEKIKTHTDKFVAIFSDNDPYVPLSQEPFFKEKLGAKTIIEHGMGHFTESDNVSELSSSLAAVEGLFSA
jgi:predicted alpha/beta hydrolase family esterase